MQFLDESCLILISGIYDQAYIDYVIAILLKAKTHGFRVFIDPHQDVVRECHYISLSY